jgi:hypothetical protein
MHKGRAGMEGPMGRPFPRVRQTARRVRSRRRLCVFDGFTVVGLLFWLKVSLQFGHASTVT